MFGRVKYRGGGCSNGRANRNQDPRRRIDKNYSQVESSMSEAGFQSESPYEPMHQEQRYSLVLPTNRRLQSSNEVPSVEDVQKERASSNHESATASVSKLANTKLPTPVVPIGLNTFSSGYAPELGEGCSASTANVPENSNVGKRLKTSKPHKWNVGAPIISPLENDVQRTSSSDETSDTSEGENRILHREVIQHAKLDSSRLFALDRTFPRVHQNPPFKVAEPRTPTEPTAKPSQRGVNELSVSPTHQRSLLESVGYASVAAGNDDAGKQKGAIQGHKWNLEAPIFSPKQVLKNVGRRPKNPSSEVTSSEDEDRQSPHREAIQSAKMSSDQLFPLDHVFPRVQRILPVVQGHKWNLESPSSVVTSDSSEDESRQSPHREAIQSAKMSSDQLFPLDHVFPRVQRILPVVQGHKWNLESPSSVVTSDSSEDESRQSPHREAIELFPLDLVFPVVQRIPPVKVVEPQAPTDSTAKQLKNGVSQRSLLESVEDVSVEAVNDDARQRKGVIKPNKWIADASLFVPDEARVFDQIKPLLPLVFIKLDEYVLDRRSSSDAIKGNTMQPSSPPENANETSSNDDEMDIAAEERKLAHLKQRLECYYEEQVKIRSVLLEFNLRSIGYIKDCNKRLKPFLKQYMSHFNYYWPSWKVKAVETLTKWKNENSPKSRDVELRYNVLLDNMDKVLIQDIIACQALGDGSSTFIESEYFCLVFSEDNTPLTLRLPTVDDYLKSRIRLGVYGCEVYTSLDKHQRRHNALRFRRNLHGVRFLNDVDKELVHFYRSDLYQREDFQKEDENSFQLFWKNRSIAARMTNPQTQKSVLATYYFEKLESLSCDREIFQIATLKLMEMTTNARGLGVPDVLWQYLSLIFKVPQNMR